MVRTPNPGRAAFASCLLLALVQGCGQSSGAQPGEASGGAPSAAAGSLGSFAGASAGAPGGSSPSDVGGAGQASLAGAGSGAAQAGTAGADAASDPLAVQTILETYRTFAAQTPGPVNVSGYIFGLCRLPTLRETEFEASIHGTERYLQDWANALAAQGIAAQGAPAFPVGAVIVKEKYAGPDPAQADRVAIALMIKRAPGFDPEHGDWDYAYYEPALGIVQTAEQSAYCAQCHAGAAATDFVYIEGLKP